MDVDVHFCGDLWTVLSWDADNILDLLLDARRIRRGQVDLVDDRHDLQPRIDGEVGVAERLRLDTLRRIHDQQRALARGKRARDLIIEVHMPGRVDQIHLVGLSVIRLVFHAHRAGLDRDAALAFKIHIIQQLFLHLALGYGFALLQQTVGQRRFAVVNVRNNGKISDLLAIFHTESSLSVT